MVPCRSPSISFNSFSSSTLFITNNLLKNKTICITIEAKIRVMRSRLIIKGEFFTCFHKVSSTLIIKEIISSIVKESNIEELFQFLIEMRKDFTTNTVRTINATMNNFTPAQIFSCFFEIRAEVAPEHWSECFWFGLRFQRFWFDDLIEQIY